jgi:hypothetical protein
LSEPLVSMSTGYHRPPCVAAVPSLPLRAWMAAGGDERRYFTSTGMLAEWAENSGA